MQYFWKQQFDLPAGLGCTYFGRTHIFSLIVVTAIVILAVRALVRAPGRAQDRFIRCFPRLMLFMELFKDAFLVRVGRFSADYLPLHLCSFGMFVFLAYSLAGTQKWQNIWGEIAFCTILPGSLSALLYPDWIAYYPVWNFMNLYSYIWHMNLVLYPLVLLNTGRIHPSIRHIYRNILFLAAVVPPILIFDKMAGVNYFFINWAPAGTPLEALYQWFGSPGWLLAYAFFAAGVIALWYGICGAARQLYRAGRKREQRQAIS